MIVLDTNVVSAVIAGHVGDSVVGWLDSLTDDVYLTSITAAELRVGVALLPEGRRRDGLHDAVEAMLLEEFRDAVIAFDEAASRDYAVIVAHRRRIGRPVGVADAQIAAICRWHGATLASRNVRDFESTGVEVINPWSRIQR